MKLYCIENSSRTFFQWSKWMFTDWLRKTFNTHFLINKIQFDWQCEILIMHSIKNTLLLTDSSASFSQLSTKLISDCMKLLRDFFCFYWSKFNIDLDWGSRNLFLIAKIHLARLGCVQLLPSISYNITPNWR